MVKMITKNAQETMDLAERLGHFLRENDLITLDGGLGAGKTTFTKGLAKGLGVKRTVNSPTYTIVKEYKGRMPLFHMDVYRLKDSEEDIGYDEYFMADGVSVVEWSDYIPDYLPESYLQVRIEKLDENKRSLSFNPKGKHYENLIEEFQNDYFSH